MEILMKRKSLKISPIIILLLVAVIAIDQVVVSTDGEKITGVLGEVQIHGYKNASCFVLSPDGSSELYHFSPYEVTKVFDLKPGEQAWLLYKGHYSRSGNLFTGGKLEIHAHPKKQSLP
jgi:hypothetical protein